MFAQLIVSGIAVGSVYTLVALGMTILYRSTTVVNFCHGEFFMIGAFAVVVSQQMFGWSVTPSIVFALVLLFLVGAAVERGLMRPLQNSPHIALAMMTVALSLSAERCVAFFLWPRSRPASTADWRRPDHRR
jgi:branched-chain amino acid transport system permease protein